MAGGLTTQIRAHRHTVVIYIEFLSKEYGTFFTIFLKRFYDARFFYTSSLHNIPLKYPPHTHAC